MTSEAIAWQRESGASMVEALVSGLCEGGRAIIRLVSAPGNTLEARVAVWGYSPTEGDRVLVCETQSNQSKEWFVVGVLHASAGRLATSSGASASVDGDRIVIRNADGQIAVVFDAATGSATITAPSGDLNLAAPQGKVAISSGKGFSAAVGEHSKLEINPNTTHVSAPSVEVSAHKASVHATETETISDRLRVTASDALYTMGRYELRATRLLERVQDAFRDVENLLQTRAGRARTIVRDTMQIFSRRTTMASKEETSIDGKRIMLG